MALFPGHKLRLDLLVSYCIALTSGCILAGRVLPRSHQHIQSDNIVRRLGRPSARASATQRAHRYTACYRDSDARQCHCWQAARCMRPSTLILTPFPEPRHKGTPRKQNYRPSRLLAVRLRERGGGYVADWAPRVEL